MDEAVRPLKHGITGRVCQPRDKARAVFGMRQAPPQIRIVEECLRRMPKQIFAVSAHRQRPEGRLCLEGKHDHRRGLDQHLGVESGFGGAGLHDCLSPDCSRQPIRTNFLHS